MSDGYKTTIKCYLATITVETACRIGTIPMKNAMEKLNFCYLATVTVETVSRQPAHK